MTYENGVQQWVNFIWPNQGSIPGARITAVDLQGQTHTIFDEPGEYGINRLIDSAQRKEQNGGFEMLWRSKTDPSLLKNQRTGQVIAAGTTNSSGCIVEISRDKGTALDIYIKSMFKGSMVKVQSFVMSKDRMVVKITSPKVLLDLKTLTNQGNNGQ